MKLSKAKSWLLQILFWLAIYLLYISQQIFPATNDSVATAPFSNDIALKAFFRLLSVAATSYFVCIYILPALLLRKKFVFGIFLFVTGIYLIALINRVAVIYILEPLLGYNNKQETILQIFSQFGVLLNHYILGNIVDALPFVIFFLLLDRQVLMRKQAETERGKKEAELTALKSQLNPHFLFNTLNNIYSLATQHADQTAICIEKLANILDYLLYKCSDKTVALEKEIALLQNYFDLQKIRFEERLALTTSFSADGSYQVAPLLLLPIVENIFKHGVEQHTERTAVFVALTVEGGVLNFTTKNLFNAEMTHTAGIGLTNLKRQLQLLYPGKHNFEITKIENLFITHLQLELT